MNLPLHVDTLLLVTEGDVDDELGCHSYHAFIKKPTRSSSATIVQNKKKTKGERAEGGVI